MEVVTTETSLASSKCSDSDIETNVQDPFTVCTLLGVNPYVEELISCDHCEDIEGKCAYGASEQKVQQAEARADELQRKLDEERKERERLAVQLEEREKLLQQAMERVQETETNMQQEKERVQRAEERVQQEWRRANGAEEKVQETEKRAQQAKEREPREQKPGQQEREMSHSVEWHTLQAKVKMAEIEVEATKWQLKVVEKGKEKERLAVQQLETEIQQASERAQQAEERSQGAQERLTVHEKPSKK